MTCSEGRLANVARTTTQRVVDTAKPGLKMCWIRDTEIPGFCLKETPVGSKLFDLDYRLDPGLWLIGSVTGIVVVGASGVLAARGAVATPPVRTLRQG